jgi:phage terminase large subunit GpA-like protein
MVTVVHIPRSAPYLPFSFLEQYPDGIRRRIAFTPAEKKILRRAKKRRPSVWCEQHRVLTMSVLRGKWKNEITPYLAGVMDASFFPSVREITVCAAPQTGKTEAVNNCIGVAIDQEPGPVMMVYPEEKTSDDNAVDRIGAMIKSSPRLRSYMTGLDDDMGKKHVRLIHLPIYFAWARSASSMANKPCRYAVNDEVDKYSDTVGKRETSAILLTKARLITYDGQEKHWIISTPTVKNGPVWKYYNAAQVRFEYWVECPACGAMQEMKFGQIKWPRKTEPDADGEFHSEDPEIIEAEKLAWYECAHCLRSWNDYERDIAVKRGQWREAETGLELFNYLKKYMPAKIAFHVPSWLSRFVSLSKIAASFLRGLSDFTEFKDFYNKHLAEPWELKIISKKEEQILAARCDLAPQTVPEDAITLTLGVDVQQNGFWFVVRAWSAILTSWLIHYGYLASWPDVEALLYESSYPVTNSTRVMRIFRACIDTGGGKKFEDMTMTEETYFWLIKNRGRGGIALWGTKGSSTPIAGGMLSLGKEKMSTPAGKKLPGGLRVISVDTVKAKDQYHFRLSLASEPETRDLPGAAFLHSATGTDYVAQILAEEKKVNEQGIEEWVNPHQRPNHLLDAEVLAAACVEMEFPGGGLRLLASSAAKAKQEQQAGMAPAAARPISQGIRNFERPGWLNR